jgi:hypothetical protein
MDEQSTRSGARVFMEVPSGSGAVVITSENRNVADAAPLIRHERGQRCIAGG